MEIGQFHIDICQLIIENLFAPYVHELDLTVDAVIISLVLRESEIENAYGVDIIKLVFPISLLRLFGYRES